MQCSFSPWGTSGCPAGLPFAHSSSGRRRSSARSSRDGWVGAACDFCSSWAWCSFVKHHDTTHGRCSWHGGVRPAAHRQRAATIALRCRRAPRLVQSTAEGWGSAAAAGTGFAAAQASTGPRLAPHPRGPPSPCPPRCPAAPPACRRHAGGRPAVGQRPRPGRGRVPQEVGHADACRGACDHLPALRPGARV
jgi:hypothetical protein